MNLEEARKALLSGKTIIGDTSVSVPIRLIDADTVQCGEDTMPLFAALINLQLCYINPDFKVEFKELK